jgi:hypothetical protein
VLFFHLGAKVRDLPAEGIKINDPAKLLKWLGRDRAMICVESLADFDAKNAAFELHYSAVEYQRRRVAPQQAGVDRKAHDELLNRTKGRSEFSVSGFGVQSSAFRVQCSKFISYHLPNLRHLWMILKDLELTASIWRIDAPISPFSSTDNTD